MTQWDWPNQQVVRADESGPGIDTPPIIEPNEARWLFTTYLGVPGAGLVSFASEDQSNPGTVWIALVDMEGDDQTERATRLVEASVLRLEAAGGAWQEYMCRTVPTMSGGVLEIVDPIHWGASGVIVDRDVLALTGYQYSPGELQSE